MPLKDGIAPGRPRFDNREESLGVGTARPRISWTPVTGAVGYEIDSTSVSGARWTAEVPATAYLGTAWVGADLSSRDQRTVAVRAITTEGISDWSEQATAEAGLLQADDWRAMLVTAPIGEGRPVFRRRFELLDMPDRARLYVTYHGVGVARINGRRVGSDVLAPGWQHYPTRLAVTCYDVRELLHAGSNLIEIELGDGWWAGHIGFNGLKAVYGSDLGVVAQLEVTTGGVTDLAVATDTDWKWAPGPTLAADLYNGETHDSTQELSADDDLGHPESWSAVTAGAAPVNTLRAIDSPPVRPIDMLPPVRVWRSPSGATLVDFGQNLVGWIQLTADGPAGAQITLRHAEVLENGELGVRPLRAAEATDRWILAGHGPETWEPAFTYHGFRYAEISGWPSGEVNPEAIRAVVVHSDMRRTGWFDTSHRPLARLHENVVWSMRGNFVSIPTDCPQRDERLGWTGDIAVFAPTATYLYDTVAFLRSWYDDLAAEQTPDGLIPYFVPSLPFPPELMSNPLFNHTHTAVWGDASTLVPFALYDASGDVEVLRRAYPTMRRWIDGVSALAGPGRVWDEGFQYGDWLDPSAPPEDPAGGATETALVATAYFAHSTRLAARAAALLDDTADSERLRALQREIVEAFRRRFVRADGRLTSDSQTAYAIALQLDLLDGPDQRRLAGQRLVELVRAAGHRIGTGFVGTPLILDALTAVGALDDAYRLVLQTQVPSWLYAVEMGATTIWERWDSMLPDGTINPGGMTSFNHYAFGAVASWLHSTVGGLSSLSPGWTRLKVAPRPHPEIQWATTAHDTPAGRAEVAWRVEGSDLVVDITVPPGTSAVLDLVGQPDEELSPGRHTIRRPWQYQPTSEESPDVLLR